jgi:hypothetical protein
VNRRSWRKGKPGRLASRCAGEFDRPRRRRRLWRPDICKRPERSRTRRRRAVGGGGWLPLPGAMTSGVVFNEYAVSRSVDGVMPDGHGQRFTPTNPKGAFSFSLLLKRMNLREKIGTSFSARTTALPPRDAHPVPPSSAAPKSSSVPVSPQSSRSHLPTAPQIVVLPRRRRPRIAAPPSSPQSSPRVRHAAVVVQDRRHRRSRSAPPSSRCPSPEVSTVFRSPPIFIS